MQSQEVKTGGENTAQGAAPCHPARTQSNPAVQGFGWDSTGRRWAEPAGWGPGITSLKEGGVCASLPGFTPTRKGPGCVASVLCILRTTQGSHAQDSQDPPEPLCSSCLSL